MFEIKYMFVILLLATSIDAWGSDEGKKCTYDPEITISAKLKDVPDYIYGFIPFTIPTRLGNNSIYLMDSLGQTISCMTGYELAKKLEVDMEGKIEYATFCITIYEDDIILATVQKYFKSDRVYFNDFYFVFLDMEFNLIPGMPSIDPYLNSENFNSGYNVAPHGIILLDEERAMVILDEYIYADTADCFPNDFDNFSFELYTTSFMVVDRQTSKEIAALSGFGFLYDPEVWWEWISSRVYNDILTHLHSDNELTHFSSIVEVPGGHWDESLTGTRTFLSSARHMNVIDLWVWDFENDNEPYFIWRMPHSSTCNALIPWLSSWDFVNDPQRGPSHAHDVNIYFEEPKHMIVHDNGDSSRYLMEDGSVCPMSRALEYKIELNGSGNGVHRATITWSYPKIENYPPSLEGWVPMSIPEGQVGEQCMGFHYYNIYLFYGGSLRRLGWNSKYIGYSRISMDHYHGGLGWQFPAPDYPYPLQYYAIFDSETNEIVSYWNTTTPGSIPFRIASKIPYTAATSLTGDYSHLPLRQYDYRPFKSNF